MRKILIILFLSSTFIFADVPKKAEDSSPLLIGEEFPMEDIKDINGKVISLEELTEDKKTIIVFYRGGWCPYCNDHLSALAQVEKEILDLGYNIIAISPDDFQNITDVKDKHGFNYGLYSDINGNLMKKVGIAFEPNFKTNMIMKLRTKGEVTELLPVPSIFILNEDGTIIFEYIHIDYKTRISAELLVAVLKNLK
jgi:peroxiredoxin